MFGLSASHLLIIGVVILFFGSRRLPELGSSLGKALHAFKAASENKNNDDSSDNQIEKNNKVT